MKKRRIVYSTDQGQLCPGCRHPIQECVCKDGARKAITDGIGRLERQSKGRNGKPVSIVKGLPLADPDLKKLAKELKAKCGVGGSIEDGNILIQGDKRDTLAPLLESKGYKVKISGG